MKSKRSVNQSRPSSPRLIGLAKPVLLGTGLAILFILSIRFELIPSEFLRRYVLGHPVSLIETGMLFVGLSFLWFKYQGLRKEAQAVDSWDLDLKQIWLGSRNQTPASGSQALTFGQYSPSGESPSIRQRVQSVANNETSKERTEDYQTADFLVSQLNRSKAIKSSSLYHRILTAIEFIKSRQSAEGIDDHLKHLSGQDQDLQHESYSLVRLMIWAIPMLGFLGTVIGISEALGGLNLGSEANLSAMIGTLKSSLYVAFDTTALALCYGVVLMFIQFGVDRKETAILQEIDEIAEQQVLDTFSSASPDRDPVARSIQKMGQALLKATFSLVEHQHELWNDSLVSAQDAWITATENAKIQSDGHLKEILDAAGDGLAMKLAGALEEADTHLRHRWQQWQVSLSENTRELAAYQENAASHLDMLQKFFDSASDLSQQQRSKVDQLTSNLSQWIEHSVSAKEESQFRSQQVVDKLDDTNQLLQQSVQLLQDDSRADKQDQQWNDLVHWSNENEKKRSQVEGDLSEGLKMIAQSMDRLGAKVEDGNRVQEKLQLEVKQKLSTPKEDPLASPTVVKPEPTIRSLPGKIGRSRPKRVASSPHSNSISQQISASDDQIEKALLGEAGSTIPYQLDQVSFSGKIGSPNDDSPSNQSSSYQVQWQKAGPEIDEELLNVLPFEKQKSAEDLPAFQAISSNLQNHQVIQDQNRQGQVVFQDEQVEAEAQLVSDETQGQLEAEGVTVDGVNPEVRPNLVPFRDARIHRTA